jgi:CHRD domain
MRKRRMLLGAIAAAGLVLGVATQVVAQGGSGDKAFFAVMTGAKEVRAGESAGDSNGRGSFSATLDGRTLCYGIQVKNIANPVDAHIHTGGPEDRGEVVVPLKHPAKGDPGATAACTKVPRSRADALNANPGGFYVNVHTAALPSGAVRGQLFARSR